MALLWKTNSGLYINEVSMKYSDPTVGTTAHFLTHQPRESMLSACSSSSLCCLQVSMGFSLMLALTNRRAVYGNTIQMQEMQQCLIFCLWSRANGQTKDSKAARPVCSPHRDRMQCGTWHVPGWCWLNLYFDLRLTFEPLAIIRRNTNSSLWTVFQPKRRAPVASNRISWGSKCVTDKI